jgi:alpha-glucosidase
MTDMHLRRVFTLDPDYFPVNRMQEIVHYLHDNQQRFSTSLPWAS